MSILKHPHFNVLSSLTIKPSPVCFLHKNVSLFIFLILLSAGDILSHD